MRHRTVVSRLRGLAPLAFSFPLFVSMLLASAALLPRPSAAEGTLWLNVAGRFVGDPGNANHQEPRIERFDGETLAFLGGWGSDDRDRALAEGPDGLLYASTAIENDVAEIRVWNPDTQMIVDTFGSWKSGPTDLAFGPEGTLFVQVPARFFSDPMNANHQAPLLEEYDPDTGAMLGSWPRSDDRERDIAVDGQGNVYATATTENDVATIRRYLASDLSSVDDTIGSWKQTPSAIEIGGGGDLYVVVQARFFGDPMNENYQAPVLEVYDPSTGMLLESEERAADTDRQLGVDAAGTVYVGRRPVSDEAYVDVYEASDLGTVADTVGSYKAGFRDVVFAPEPGPAAAGLAFAAVVGLGRLRRARR